MSYGQGVKYDTHYKTTINYVLSKKSHNFDIVFNSDVKFGIGFDLFSDNVMYDEHWNIKVNMSGDLLKLTNYWTNSDFTSVNDNSKRNGTGVYLITPTIKNFDLLIGGGGISFLIKDTYETGDYVSGYTRSNGTYVNGYYRNKRMVSSYVKQDQSFYLFGGITKSFKIVNGVYLQVRGITRYLPKYGNEELGRVFKPELMLGLKVKID
jgi:hypothetical protein